MRTAESSRRIEMVHIRNEPMRGVAVDGKIKNRKMNDNKNDWLC